MKTAYTITMHCPLNYGAILQTYGLQKYLESLGIKVTIINYRPHYIIYDQSLLYVGDERFNGNFLTRWLYRFFKAPSKRKRSKIFAKFAKNELNLSPEYRTYKEICDAGLDADYFICGSDQIWNVVSNAHKDPAYLLGFVSDSKKKISYAASGNLPISNEEVMKITIPMINDIGHLSMREDTTISSLQPFINKPIQHVCDPVFLLDSESWRNLYKKHSTFKPKEKYVLIYPMGNGGENVIKKGYELAQKLHLPLYKISASKRNDKRIDKSLDVSPYEFLQLIDECECFVTNSFHGTSFSIIFEKKFWSCVAEGSNQRLSSLLSICGLSSRMISSDYVFHKPEEVVDYTDAKRKLGSFINSSKDFLKDIVQ